MENPYAAPGVARSEPAVVTPRIGDSLSRLGRLGAGVWVALAGLGFLEGGVAAGIAGVSGSSGEFGGADFVLLGLFGLALEVLVAGPLYAWAVPQLRGAPAQRNISQVLRFRLVALPVAALLTGVCALPGMLAYVPLAVGTAFKALGRSGSIFNLREQLWRPLLVVGGPFALFALASLLLRLQFPAAWRIVGVYVVDAVLSGVMILTLAAWMLEFRERNPGQDGADASALSAR